jgi:hypothetical protein
MQLLCEFSAGMDGQIEQLIVLTSFIVVNHVKHNNLPAIVPETELLEASPSRCCCGKSVVPTFIDTLDQNVWIFSAIISKCFRGGYNQ